MAIDSGNPDKIGDEVNFTKLVIIYVVLVVLVVIFVVLVLLLYYTSFVSLFH